MNLKSFKKIVIFITFLSLINSSLIMPINSSSDNNNNIKFKSSSPNSLTNVVSVEKRLNQTTAFVDDILIVEILITNHFSTAVYNVTLNEDEFLNPQIITSYLISPLTIPILKSNERTLIAYTISASKATNFTISASVITYQLVETQQADTQTLTTFSQSITVSFLEKNINQVDLNTEYTIIYSVLLLSYSILLVIRIIFRTKAKSTN